MTDAHSAPCGTDVAAYALGALSGDETRRFEVAAYALGALSGDETRRFEAHLDTCDLCRTDLAALRPVVAALPSAADQLAPPPALRKRVMRVVESEARERERASRPQRERRPLLSFRPLPALAAACALVLGGVGIGVAVIDGDDAPPTTIAGQCNRGCERVAMRVVDGHGTLKVRGMDEPPEGRVYQVWTQRFGHDPKPTDALFTVDKYGRASVDVPGDTRSVDQVLVTAEPRGGSSVPSTAPYLEVRL